MGSRKVAYLLARYEGMLRTEKSEAQGTSGIDFGRLTVEHILPQKWQEHWPLPDHAPPEAEARREEVLHRFGNLTILSGSLNTSVSNEAWTKKRTALLSHGQLLMNGRLSLREEWDESAIAERGEEIAIAFCRIWSRE